MRDASSTMRREVAIMKLRSFSRFFVEASQSLRRNILMTIASIATIALTLFVCGVFSVIVLNFNKFANDIEPFALGLFNVVKLFFHLSRKSCVND